MTSIPSGWRPWVWRASAFAAAGVLGSVLVGVVSEWLFGLRADWVPLILGAPPAIVSVALPTWWLVLRDGRAGPAWGAVVGASAPVLATALQLGVMVVAGDDPVLGVLYGAALFVLLASPATVVLAATGAFLASGRGPGGRAPPGR